MSWLGTLLTTILFLGDFDGAGVAEQTARALGGSRTGGPRVEVAQQPPADPAERLDHLILMPRLPPEGDARLRQLSDAVQGLDPGRLWLMQVPPASVVSPGWAGEIAAASGEWRRAAAALGAELIPAASVLPELLKEFGPEGLSHEGYLDDRGNYALAVVVAGALGADIGRIPDHLVRRWMWRGGAVKPEFGAAARRVALRLPPETLPPPTDAAPTGPEAVVPQPEAAPRILPPAAPADPVAVPPATREEAKPLPEDAGVMVPGIGFGLATFADWTVSQPFLDLMKTARPWIGHREGHWGAVSFEELAAGGHLDSRGWLTSLPEGVTAVSTIFLADLPEGSGGLAGRYRMSWKGNADLQLTGRAEQQVRGDHTIDFDYSPGEGHVELRMRAPDPSDPLRDLSVIRLDRLELVEAGQIFNPDLLARLRGAEVIRFMDWMLANTTTIATREDLPRPEDFSYVWRGAPPEIMVALANELKAEPWFTLPWRAEPELHRAYAEVVRDGLDPSLRAWIEYTNEAWNMDFPQARGLEEEARRRWGQDWRWMQLYGLKAAEMVAAWDEVFGPEQRDRLVRVLSSQTGWPGLETELLEAPLLRREGLEPPVTRFDAWAVTGYFSGGVGHPEKDALLQSWMQTGREAAEAAGRAAGLSGAALEAHIRATRFEAAIPPALEDLRDGRHSGERTTSLQGLLEEQLPWHARVAAENGLRLVMYEGGTHALAYGPSRDDPEVTAFFAALNYSPGMAELYLELLEGWRGLSDAPFLAYVDILAPSRYGSWGALRHLTDDNPRWRALSRGERP